MIRELFQKLKKFYEFEMAEAIFKFPLHDNNESNNNNVRYINPLLISELAKPISLKLAEGASFIGKDFFHSERSEPQYEADLVFIKQTCINFKRPFQVNGINKSTILSLLEKKYGTIIEETDRNEMKNDSIAEIKERLPLLLANRVRDLKRIKQINLEIMRVNIYNKAREIQFRNGIELNIPSDQELMEIYANINEKTNTTQINEEMIENSVESFSRSNEYRLKHVEFGYSILNLGSTYENKIHLQFLLNSISSYKEMHDFEKRFCEYHFKFIDQNPDLVEFYRNQLFFILEILIINICTSLITIPTEAFHYEITKLEENEDFNCMIVACKLDAVIHEKITDVLHSLYFLSNFNRKILDFAEKIKLAVI